MAVISAISVSKTFDERPILDEVSLSVEDGERIGVVGNNGSGKSTLGAILAGLVEVDAGTVALQRGAEVGYLAQDPRFEPGLSVRDAVLSGLGAWTRAHERYERATHGVATSRDGGDVERWIHEQAAAAEDVERAGGWERLHEAESILGHLGVDDLAASVDTLSGGRRRAVALAQVLLSAPPLAILDEPTNHLDLTTIEWLESYLRDSYRGAVVLITHDRYLLDRVVTRTIEIDRGSLFSYDGGYESYLAAKAERIAHAERTEANRQNFLRGELEWLRRSPKARTTKSRSRVQRAEQALAEKVPERDRTAELRISATRSGKTILDVEGLSLEIAGRRVVDGLTLRLGRGERIGIVGPNGCGKTTLLRGVLGAVEPAAGRIQIGKNTEIAYLDQNRGDLDEHATVEENVVGDRGHFEVAGREMSVRAYLERFLFDGGIARRQVATLSGGERARVALARMLASRANLILLDEPTNDLDVATLGALEAMILEFGGSALLVSHDRWFLDRLATAILAFEEDGTITRYEGGYSDYLDKLLEEQRSAGPAAVDRTAPRADDGTRRAAPAATEKPRKLTYAERIELEGLLPRVEEAEVRVAELESRLADPDLYAAGGDAVKALMAELEEARAHAAELTARWEELEAKQS